MCFIIITVFVFVIKVCDLFFFLFVSSGSHEDVQAVLCSMYIFIINGVTDLSLYLSPDSVGISQ